MAEPEQTTVDTTQLAAEMRPALVLYFKRKTGNSSEAEDLAHDVITRALTRAEWKSHDEAKGYIFRSAVNRLHDRYRRTRTHGTNVSWDETFEHALGVENSPERVLIIREDLHQVVQVLEGLHERTRTVLMLIRLEKMKASTVAEMLGISVSAVNKHLASAVAQLAKLRRRADSP